MLNPLGRIITTFMIWGALTLIMVALIVTPGWADLTLIFLGAILGAAAYFSTRAVWNYSDESSAEKSKRSGRVDQVLKRLNDAELDELRARLMESDGEMLTLNDLLAERERRTGGR